MLLTQGTTGKPKGVTLSHGAFIVQSLVKIAIVGYSEDDVCFSLWYAFVILSCTVLPLSEPKAVHIMVLLRENYI